MALWPIGSQTTAFWPVRSLVPTVCLRACGERFDCVGMDSDVTYYTIPLYFWQLFSSVQEKILPENFKVDIYFLSFTFRNKDLLYLTG